MRSSSFTTTSGSTQRRGPGGVFSLEIVEEKPGFLLFRASGKGANNLFANEAGGHRYQRIPPTEKRGRVQSSSVTVAVLREPQEHEFAIRDSDLDIRTTRGSGPGGQNRNKVESAVVVTHKPTGVTVRAESERSQHQNKALALSTLRARLLEKRLEDQHRSANAERRAQVGSGMRGDKVRTVQVRNGIVTDHRTGKKIPYEKFARGHFEELA